MGFDHDTFVIDARQLAVSTDIQLLTDVLCGYRVQGVAGANMVIGVRFAPAPFGYVKALFLYVTSHIILTPKYHNQLIVSK
jgi:hypothetical protein